MKSSEKAWGLWSSEFRMLLYHSISLPFCLIILDYSSGSIWSNSSCSSLNYYAD